MEKTLQQQCCALLLLLVLLLGGSYTAAHARCNPIPFVNGAIVPDNAVFCVGEPVAWASEICYKPEECCTGYVRPNCFWDVTADNRYEIGDPIFFSNGWCATLTLNGPAYHTIDGGMIVFDEPGAGTVTGSITEATPGCRECTRQDGPWTPTEANFNVIGGWINTAKEELKYYCAGPPDGTLLSAASGQPACVTYAWSVTGPARIDGSTTGSSITLVADIPPQDQQCYAIVRLTYTCSTSPEKRCVSTQNIVVRRPVLTSADYWLSLLCLNGEKTFKQIPGIDPPEGCNASDPIYGYIKPVNYCIKDQCGNNAYANTVLSEYLTVLCGPAWLLPDLIGGSTDANGCGEDDIGILTCDTTPFTAGDIAGSLQQKFVLDGCVLVNNCVQEHILVSNPTADPQVCGRDYSINVSVMPFTGYLNCPCP